MTRSSSTTSLTTSGQAIAPTNSDAETVSIKVRDQALVKVHGIQSGSNRRRSPCQCFRCGMGAVPSSSTARKVAPAPRVLLRAGRMCRTHRTRWRRTPCRSTKTDRSDSTSVSCSAIVRRAVSVSAVTQKSLTLRRDRCAARSIRSFVSSSSRNPRRSTRLGVSRSIQQA